MRKPTRFRWTIRLRLTLLYGALFLATGVLLLALTYVLVAHTSWTGEPAAPPEPAVPSGGLPAPERPPLQQQLARQRDQDLRELLVASGIALTLMTFVSAGLGWVVAGRALRPLRSLTVTAKSISAHDLHRRMNAQGPADEIKELADTFDRLLDHLEDAFEAQRRFVANASHELRTPLTFQRSLLEVTLADTDATQAELREACRQALAGNEQQGQLIEALLTLARSQRGLGVRAELDLARLAGPIVDSARSDCSPGLRIDAELHPALISGDRALIERLIANLVDNSLRHNVSGGWVTVRTGVDDGRPTLSVRNSGPQIPPAQLGSLFEPFQRLHATRMNGQDGIGVGLSIVAAVTKAHDAELYAQPIPDGGLDLQIRFTREPSR